MWFHRQNQYWLQNTAARIAWTTRKGLAQSSLEQSNHPVIRLLLGLLLIGAILIGNAAYEAGNLSGALIGLKGILSMETLTFGGSLDWFPLLLGLPSLTHRPWKSRHHF